MTTTTRIPRKRVCDWFGILELLFPFRRVVGGGLLAAVGLVLLLGPHPAEGGAALLVLGLMALGIVAAGRRLRSYLSARSAYQSRPAGAQMLAWLRADLDRVKDASLAQFGRTASDLVDRSAVIPSPVEDVEGDHPSETMLCPIGPSEAEGYLFRRWRLTVLHFTHAVLYVWQAEYDWCKDEVSQQTRLDIPYDHVVSVLTEPTRAGGYAMAISLSNGETFQVEFGGGEFKAANEPESKAETDRAVQAIYSRGRPRMNSTARMPAVVIDPGGQPVAVRSVGRFCGHCGQPVGMGSAFCTMCGSRLV